MYSALELKKIFKDAKFLNWDNNFSVVGVSHDTRKLSQNYMYVAIKGSNYDGHDFVKNAKDLGASCVLLEKAIDVDIPQILIKDSVLAYLDLANDWRKKIKLKDLISITGSNGKTTTKDLLFHILSSEFETFKNQGNLNNFIGLPFSILQFPKKLDYGILEMGMNSFGEIKKLTQVSQPTIGIVTNIGDAHIGFLKTKENISKEKLELFNYLINQSGSLVINLSDLMIKKWFDKTDLKTNYITYSYYDGAGDLKIKSTDDLSFKVFYKDKTYDGVSPLYGEHNLLNIASALSVACLLGLNLEHLIRKLETFKTDDLRSNYKLINGVHYFIDCYNANPNSMSSSLSVYKGFKNIKRKIAILGDMLELGNKAEENHRKIGAEVFKNKYDFFIAYGDYSNFYKEGFLKAGGNKNLVFTFPKNEVLDLKKHIKKMIRRDDFLIVKASRSLKIEKILED